MTLKVSPSDSGLSDSGPALSASRQELVASLVELEKAADLMRRALDAMESDSKRTRREIEQGVGISRLHNIDQSATNRNKANVAMVQIQRARHRCQRAMFHLAILEGSSLAEIARSWGVSRQLVSRMTKERSDYSVVRSQPNGPTASR